MCSATTVRSVCFVALRSQVVVSGRVRLNDLSATDGLQLSSSIYGICRAPAQNCVLLVDSTRSDSRVLRVSLAKKRVDQCLIRVPHTDADVSDVQLLPGGTHIALALYKGGIKNEYSHIVRLFAESQLIGWSVTHEFCFETTSCSINVFYTSRLCVSRNLLLCAAPVLSRRLVALKVTRDSKLVQTGAVQFDSAPSDLCAFTVGNDQLVAIAHADRTVHLWRHVETAAAARRTFTLEKCSRVSADTTCRCLISSAAGLLLLPDYPVNTMRLCRIDGTHLDAPFPLSQLKPPLNLWCACAIGLNVLLYDRESESLVTLKTRGSNAKHSVAGSRVAPLV